MDREKEHIIADKTMLRVARVTSMVFGVSGVIPVFLSPYHADGI